MVLPQRWVNCKDFSGLVDVYVYSIIYVALLQLSVVMHIKLLFLPTTRNFVWIWQCPNQKSSMCICCLTMLLTVDIFKSAAWQEVEAIEDPKLQELAQLLPMVALRSRAPSTVKRYRRSLPKMANLGNTKVRQSNMPPSVTFTRSLLHNLPNSKVVHQCPDRGSIECNILGPPVSCHRRPNKKWHR